MKTTIHFLLITFSFCILISSAEGQVRFGAKAGINFANQNWNGFQGGVDTHFRPSYMIGGVVEFDFTEFLGFGTGLQLQGKGTNDVLFNTPISYLQIPAQVQYRNNGYFVALGPYVAYAISGKYKQANGDDITLSFGNGEKDDFTAIDYGITLEAGYEFRQIRLTGSYSAGIANNIARDNRPNYQDGAFVKNTVVTVGVTVLFGYY